MNRPAVVSLLRSLVGLTSPDPRYLAIATPGDTITQAISIARGSSECILVALGVEELVFQTGDGDDEIPLRGPYVAETAPVILERRAGGSPMAFGGAMRAATLDAPPSHGDAVWYGESSAVKAEHVEHVALVTPLGPAALRLECVAGGKRDGAGNETIALMPRILDWNGRQWQDRGTQRPVIGVVDLELLGERYTPREEYA